MNARNWLFIIIMVIGWIVSPDIALASEEESKWGIFLILGKFFNLALVVMVLVWAARKPLSNFFANRTQTIRDQLVEAQEARREAEAKLAEIESRMSRLDDELNELRKAAEKEGKEEYERLTALAEQDAEKILERSRQEIEGMLRTAQLELKAHAAELSINLAEEKIRSEITNDDHSRLFTRFVTMLGGKQ